MPYPAGHTLLDKYRIESLLGQGAFAEVYRATHLALNAPRALKILRRDAPGLGSTEFSDFRARFQLEAQLGARLDHPNIIRVYDFEQDGETLILVMEYAEGGSLAEKISKARAADRPIPIEEAIQIALEVATGLSVLHALDAVHRDLKPSNILFDRKGRAKVADVGLAQIPGGPSLRSQLSQAAPHPGTPGYMSPEQESISTYLTPASDVYALGLVLFETLTGRVYAAQRPGTRVGNLRADLPDWLDDLLARMLAKEPQDRPWDGGEAAALLRQGAELEDTKRRAEAARREAEKRAEREAQEKAKSEGEERARREAETRAAEIARLKGEAEAALKGARWQQVERLAEQLSRLEIEGQEEARRLRARLSVAKKEADERERQQAAEIARLEQDIETALDSKDWGQAKRLIARLEALGGEGRSGAARYRARLPGYWTRIPPWVWVTAAGLVVLGVILSFAVNGWPAASPEIITATPVIVVADIPVPELASTFTPEPTNTSRPTATRTRTPTSLPARITDDHGAPMGLVPAGPFTMGGDADVALAECQKLYIRGDCQRSWFEDEVPAHSVTLGEFYIDQYEVTNKRYAACVEAGDCGPPHVVSSYTRSSYYGNAQYDDYPVIHVTWYGAQKYCEWRGARLPTEAEWEKAARGTDERTYPWGEGIDCTKANFVGCVGDTAAVGSYPEGVSPYGLFDMAGNVWERVTDWYKWGYYANSPDSNPTGPPSGFYHVWRGGSWGHDGGDLRVTRRGGYDPSTGSYLLGFRCALSP